MANGTRWTEEDLRAKGLKADARGIFHFLNKGAVVENPNFRDQLVILPVTIKPRPKGLIAIENVLRAAGIPFINEYVFSAARKFRFDVAVPQMMLAIEYEGIFTKDQSKNGHTGVKHYIKDCTKYNLAVVEGWKVLRYTAKNYKNFLNDLQQLLTSKP